MSEIVSGCKICPIVARPQPGHIERLGYWNVDLSLEQGYFGQGFIALNRHCPDLAALNATEWLELKTIIERYEAATRAAFGAEMFNWTCLMNDAYKAQSPQPHVYWHVRPRYRKPVTIEGHDYIDPNFGHHYDSKHRFYASDDIRIQLATAIKEHF